MKEKDRIYFEEHDKYMKQYFEDTKSAEQAFLLIVKTVSLIILSIPTTVFIAWVLDELGITNLIH